jgi:hypothetical protein
LNREHPTFTLSRNT